MKEKLLDLAKKLYAIPTVYRLVWTGIQVGAGAAVTAFGADPKVGVLVSLLAVVVTSVTREKLAAKKV